MLNLVFEIFPQLRTPRCILRPLEFSDEAAVFSIRSSDEVNLYLNRKKADSPEEAREFIGKIRELVLSGETFYWAIELEEVAGLIGTILLFNINPEQRKAEIGYELLPAFQGRGIMTEVMKEVIRFGFEEMHLELIEAYLSPRNEKSIRLLQRHGFSFAAIDTQSGGAENLFIYSLKPAN